MYAHLSILKWVYYSISLHLTADHAKTLTELPDESLADIGPLIKKVAVATGAEEYNILQVSGPSVSRV